MFKTNTELLVSTTDAKTLSGLLGDRRRAHRFEADAADALADALLDARTVPDDRLPADRVAMNSRVVYREESRGEHRSVSIVHPDEANLSLGRISVLSPVGRALLGRKVGSVASIRVPGRELALRVLEVERLAPADGPGDAS
jgi:regulator of nucleoside diphosphate kinase